MAKKVVEDHVKLPCLKSISVEGYPLFTENWSYKIKPGLNLFLGVNGVGKTTTTNLIIYGLIGVGEGRDYEYFSQRIEALRDSVEEDDAGEDVDQDNEEDVEETEPSVKIEFTVGEHSFMIERHIIDNYVSDLVIDGEQYDPEAYDDLDKIYEIELLEKSGFDSIEDFAFILEAFLVRVEEGNYLLWDDKGGAQARLIRVLLNQSGFERKYQHQATEVKKLDSKVRGTMDTKAQVEKSLKVLRQERENELSKNKVHVEKKDIEKQLKETESKYQELRLVHDKATDHLNIHKENILKTNGQIDITASERDTLAEQITDLENKFYRHVYSDDKVLLALNKLKVYNICIYCGKEPREKISQAIIASVEQCKCPVCQSRIDGAEAEEAPDEETIAKLEELKIALKQSQVKLNYLTTNLSAAKIDFDNTFKQEREISGRLTTLSVEVYDLKLQLSRVSSNPKEEISKYDSDIKALEKQIEKYDDQIRPLKEDHQKALDKLTKMRDKQNNLLGEFSTRLNEIFVEYSDKYFKENCELQIVERKPKESNVKVNSFVPYFDNSQRYTIDKCSTSQRIMMEYLFRFSIMELYQEISGNKSLMILETSEGAFDITSTKQLAGALTRFGKTNMPFVTISNFNKIDFLKEIVNNMGSSRKSRVLNFIDFSRLTALQNDDINRFKGILKSLKLN